MYDITGYEPEGRRLSPFAAIVMIGGTCLAMWSAIVSAAFHLF
jgi:hypothetical protein